MTTDRLLTADEVAAMLSVPRSWVREATRAGQLPHVPIGRYRRYVEADVLAWVEAQKAGGGPRASRRYAPVAAARDQA